MYWNFYFWKNIACCIVTHKIRLLWVVDSKLSRGCSVIFWSQEHKGHYGKTDMEHYSCLKMSLPLRKTITDLTIKNIIFWPYTRPVDHTLHVLNAMVEFRLKPVSDKFIKCRMMVLTKRVQLLFQVFRKPIC